LDGYQQDDVESGCGTLQTVPNDGYVSAIFSNLTIGLTLCSTSSNTYVPIRDGITNLKGTTGKKADLALAFRMPSTPETATEFDSDSIKEYKKTRAYLEPIRLLQSIERVVKHIQAWNDPVVPDVRFNAFQTKANPLVPLFIIQEVKSPTSASDDGMLQLSYCAAAQIYALSRWMVDQDKLCIPLVCLRIYGPTWDAWIAEEQFEDPTLNSAEVLHQPRKRRIVMAHVSTLGDISTPAGIFKVHTALCKLAKWHLDAFLPWFEREICHVDSNNTVQEDILKDLHSKRADIQERVTREQAVARSAKRSKARHSPYPTPSPSTKKIRGEGIVG
jgi:hypothetical protein